jgi:NAD(P)H-hydrate epimerase
MRIVTAAELRACDRATSERFGIASTTLMENAGTAVADFALANFPATRKIVVVCGKGNNGGDGLVAARKLSQAGKQVVVFLLAKPSELMGGAGEMLAQSPVEPIAVSSEGEFREAVSDGIFECDLVIDAILGTGFKPPVTGLYAEAISAMNLTKVPVLAVDVPSGVDADAMQPMKAGSVVARAETIVTFTAPRPAHVFGRLTNGPTVVAPIGSPEEAIASELKLNLITAQGLAQMLAPRAPDAHKGDFGHVLIVGGSVGKAGAAAMAGMGALRAGAGLTTVACPKSVLPTVAGFAPELMTEPLDETESGGIALKALEYGRMEKLCENKDALAIGPGLGQHPETQEFVRSLVESSKLPVVLDADGLNAFAGQARRLDGSKRPLVLTPHPGEFSRLCGKSVADIAKDPVAIARDFAASHKCTLMLKGHRTLVVTPEGDVWVNVSGNAGMAKGGSGDVLTGMMVALMARSKRCAAESAGAAVYLHGLAGDIAREQVGERSMVASDILAAVGDAFHRAAAQVAAKTVTINP